MALDDAQSSGGDSTLDISGSIIPRMFPPPFSRVRSNLAISSQNSQTVSIQTLGRSRTSKLRSGWTIMTVNKMTVCNEEFSQISVLYSGFELVTPAP
jgi:hypothetical protein